MQKLKMPTPAAYMTKLFMFARMTKPMALPIRPMALTTFAPTFLPSAPKITTAINDTQPDTVTT